MISMSLRPAWSTKRTPGQPRVRAKNYIERKTFPKKKKIRQNNKTHTHTPNNKILIPETMRRQGLYRETQRVNNDKYIKKEGSWLSGKQYSL